MNGPSCGTMQFAVLYEEFLESSSGGPSVTPRQSVAIDDTFLRPGLQIVAYYPNDHDSAELHARVEQSLSKLLGGLSGLNVDYATSRSTVIYITFTFIQDSSKAVDITQILGSLLKCGTGQSVRIVTDKSRCEEIPLEEGTHPFKLSTSIIIHYTLNLLT